MSWTDDEIDELLVRYLDQELSSDEVKQFEDVLAAQPIVQGKLTAWKDLRQGLLEIRKQAGTGRELGPTFADRVVRAAGHRVEASGDPHLAPWIARTSAIPTVEAARRLQNRDSDAHQPASRNSRRSRTWLFGMAATGIAASLLAIVLWSPSKPIANTLLSENEPTEAALSPPIRANQEPQVTRSNSVVFDGPLPDRVAIKDAFVDPSTTIVDPQRPNVETLASKEGKNNNGPMSTSSKLSNDARGFTVGPSLEPTAEQLKMLEGMLTNPNGIFLFVVDVSLPSDVTDLDTLRQILDRHDIAWSSQLDIDEAMQTNLAKSRMIAEAGKGGLIADFKQPNVTSKELENGLSKNGEVSLIFVKARGTRLDAALIEVMQRVDEFPNFSFDLAFDPPTQTLMNELRFIQEASLPTTNRLDSQSFSSLIRRTGKGAEVSSLNHFAAGPRRSKAMSIETRRQGKMPLDSETLNPIAYALFIVRQADRNESK